MKPLAGLFILLGLGSLFASQRPNLGQLKAKAEQAQDGDRALLCAEIVGELVEVADHYYIEGTVDKAEATMREIVEYAKRARDSARGTNRKIKQTEIHLRKAQRRLEDIRRTLAASDQPRAKETILQLEAVRKELLEQMFGLKPGSRKNNG